jgi:cytochrome oxidase Cu insertion factor (SCO1/SenC/PrrC family)
VIRRVAPALVGAVVLLSLARAAPAAGPDLGALGLQAYESPGPAPAFSLPDVAGRTWNLAELRGKVVLLFFWATW